MPLPAHSELSGSTSFRWIRCPGSVGLIRSIRQDGVSQSINAAAREGTFAHAVAAHILNGNKIDIDEPFTFYDHDVELSWPIPTDMLEHTDVYVDRVRRHAAGGHVVLVEHHVDLSFVRDGMFGTVDAAIVKPNILVVNDFKYGHVPVRLIDHDMLLDSTYGELGHVNPQLLYYAAGLAKEYRWSHDAVTLEITQPRCVEVAPVQSTTIATSALRDWAENDLWEAAHLATVENAPLVAGDQCRFCPALGVCPAAREAVQEEAGADFAEVAEDILEVPEDIDRLARVLKWAPYIDAWIRACEVAAFERMRSGEAVEGFKLVEKKTHRAWPTQDPKKLAKMLEIKDHRVLLADPELLSPAKVEKIIGKKAVKAVAVYPPGDLTIAAESDRRPAVEVTGDFDDLN